MPNLGPFIRSHLEFHCKPFQKQSRRLVFRLIYALTLVRYGLCASTRYLATKLRLGDAGGALSTSKMGRLGTEAFAGKVLTWAPARLARGARGHTPGGEESEAGPRGVDGPLVSLPGAGSVR